MDVVGLVLGMPDGGTSDGALLGAFEADGPAVEELNEGTSATLGTLDMLGIADNVGCAVVENHPGDGATLGKSKGDGEAVGIADAKVGKREFPDETDGTCVGARVLMGEAVVGVFAAGSAVGRSVGVIAVGSGTAAGTSDIKPSTRMRMPVPSVANTVTEMPVAPF